MTQQELQWLVEELSLSVFNKPFTHRAVFNSRLKTTGGRYHLSDHHLDFNPTMLTEHGMEVFIGIIKHELCHYHLHLAGLGHRHQDPAFKALLARTGGLRYAPPAKRTAKHRYRCQNCGCEIRRQRRVDIKKYVCGKCRGRLLEIGNDEKSQVEK